MDFCGTIEPGSTILAVFHTTQTPMTVMISKNGSPQVVVEKSITNFGQDLYSFQLTSSDTSVLGPLIITVVDVILLYQVRALVKELTQSMQGQTKNLMSDPLLSQMSALQQQVLKLGTNLNTEIQNVRRAVKTQ